jgi:hypothetical protein
MSIPLRRRTDDPPVRTVAAVTASRREPPRLPEAVCEGSLRLPLPAVTERQERTP